MIVLFDTRGLATAPPTIVAGAAIALDSNVARTGIKDGFTVMLRNRYYKLRE